MSDVLLEGCGVRDLEETERVVAGVVRIKEGSGREPGLAEFEEEPADEKGTTQ